MARKPQGFATLSSDERKAIARLGGLAVPASKRTFAVNRELAAEAGSTGGKNIPDEKRGFAVNRELASAAGRKGGLAVAPDKRAFSNREIAAAAGRKGGKSRRKGGDG